MRKIKIINCTPHAVNIIGGETFPVSGIIPRVKEEKKEIKKVKNITIFEKSFSNIEGLPDKCDNIFLIVSALVTQACQDRDDLIVPNTVRDESGKIIGCDSFSILKKGELICG
jgi:hypothetical protein